MSIINKLKRLLRWRRVVRDTTTGRFVGRDRAKADPAGTVTERFPINRENDHG